MTSAPWQNRIVGTEEVPPATLTANPKNWRKHPAAQKKALASVLDTVGWVQNVIVNRRTGNIIDGHARVELAMSRGEATVPVVYVDVDEEDEALILATLDPLSAMATTDKAQLEALFEELSDSGRLVEVLGHFRRLPGAGLTDPDAVPEPPTETVTRLGDAWLLSDSHRILCGDATNAADVASLMEGERATALWTDPPYGVDYEGATSDRLRISNDQGEGLTELLHEAFQNAREALEAGAPFYIAHPSGGNHLIFWLAVRDAGWQIHQELVWVKDSMVLGHADYHFRHESLIYGWLPGPGRSGRGRHEGTRWFGDHSQTSVFEIDRPKASRDHPTAKPVELIERCLANSTEAGALVYEPFCGSGSTIIAAERLGRRCYAMEIDPRYVDVAIRRWEEFTGEKAERVSVTQKAPVTR